VELPALARALWSHQRAWHGDKVNMMVLTELVKDGIKFDLTITGAADAVIDTKRDQAVTDSKITPLEYTIDWKDKALTAKAVTGTGIDGLLVQFEIRTTDDALVIATLDAVANKKKWTAPLTPADVKYHFYAILRAKPEAKNGHMTVLQRVKSGELTAKSAKVT